MVLKSGSPAAPANYGDRTNYPDYELNLPEVLVRLTAGFEVGEAKALKGHLKELLGQPKESSIHCRVSSPYS